MIICKVRKTFELKEKEKKKDTRKNNCFVLEENEKKSEIERQNVKKKNERKTGKKRKKKERKIWKENYIDSFLATINEHLRLNSLNDCMCF